MSRALGAGQVAAAGQLAPVEGLTVVEAGRRVTVLRELLQGSLGLSTGGRAKRGQEVRGGLMLPCLCEHVLLWWQLLTNVLAGMHSSPLALPHAQRLRPLAFCCEQVVLLLRQWVSL